MSVMKKKKFNRQPRGIQDFKMHLNPQQGHALFLALNSLTLNELMKKLCASLCLMLLYSMFKPHQATSVPHGRVIHLVLTASTLCG